MDNNRDNLPPYSYRNKPPRNPYMPFIYALILSFGVMLGYMVNSITVGKQPILGTRYNKVDEILNYINSRYVDTINRADLMDKTIDKMLSNLDPHSVYIPKKDLAEMNESLEGNFEGIGIEFFVVQDTITVVTPISGGPSEAVGLKAGDRIIKINDSLVAGIKIKDTEVKKRLRGPKGTTVKVSILRAAQKQLIDYAITRDKIPLTSIDASFMLNSETGYMRITSFSASTHEEFISKFSDLTNEGMKNFILDLRSNPGGYLQAATALADEFISGNKLLVYTKGKSFERQDYKARKDGVFEKGGLCILIDEGSASASEILSGAVQDWDRGTILGRTSFGKGLVQEQFELKDGSGLRLTVARYYTPSGRSIQRSYENGAESYYNEIYERYKRGEFVHQDSIIPDSIELYKTSKGRPVFGGGGIRPDIFVPLDTSGENEYFLRLVGLVREFIYKYTSLHEDVLAKYKTPQEFNRDFELTEEIIKSFYHYAEEKGVSNGIDKRKLIEKKLKLNLKAFLARQKWRMDGYYYIESEDDPVVQRALQQLQTEP